MPEQSSRQEHFRIAAQVPDATQLAEGHASLPTYVMPIIESGNYVPVGKQHAFEADFDNISVLVERNLIDEFSVFKETLSSSESTPLLEALKELPENTRELFIAAVYAAQVAAEFFSDEAVDKKIRDEQGWLPVDPSREDTYQIKKLSESSNESYCVETSLVMGEILKRLGKDMQYTVGYRQFWLDEPGVYHAFLTADQGNVIVDPRIMMSTLNTPKPEGLLMSAGEATIFDNTQAPCRYKDIFNRMFHYSASPIPAVDLFDLDG